jgi:hypothetical protein
VAKTDSQIKPYDKPYGKSDYVVGVNQEKQLFFSSQPPVHFGESLHRIHYGSDSQKTVVWQRSADSL